MWGFPKIRGTLLGVPVIRIIVFWGLYWGSLILGNYHVRLGLLNPAALLEIEGCPLRPGLNNLGMNDLPSPRLP